MIHSSNLFPKPKWYWKVIVGIGALFLIYGFSRFLNWIWN